MPLDIAIDLLELVRKLLVGNVVRYGHPSRGIMPQLHELLIERANACSDLAALLIKRAQLKQDPGRILSTRLTLQKARDPNLQELKLLVELLRRRRQVR